MLFNRLTALPSVPVTDSSKNPKSLPNQQGLQAAQTGVKLNQLNQQLQNYIQAFRISGCAISAHMRNKFVILQRVNEEFDIRASNFSQVEQQLSRKIRASSTMTDENRENALEQVSLMMTTLTMLDSVRIAVSNKAKADNRDRLEIQIIEGNTQQTERIGMSGGMKIDFSAGFVLTGLKDYSYVLKPFKEQYEVPVDSVTKVTRDTVGNVITREPTGSRDIGISLLTHFYPRISSHYNIGGAVGLMTSTDLNVRLMLGGSLMISSIFGSNHRVSFTGGVVWGKVKRLSVQHERFLDSVPFVNGVPQYFSGTPTLADRSEKSWFFSVNFNFGGN
jgi:hypothetical protein